MRQGMKRKEEVDLEEREEEAQVDLVTKEDF